MDTTHAELIEDLADLACWRSLGRPRCRAEYRARLRLQTAACAFGNHALARAEDLSDAMRDVAASLRMALELGGHLPARVGVPSLRAVCARL